MDQTQLSQYISKFDEKQENKSIEIKKKAESLKIKVNNLESDMIQFAFDKIEKDKKKFCAEHKELFDEPPDKIYVHIDLDSFFASVEMLDKPEYRQNPVGVGSMYMLSTCNYEARKYGIKSGMPGYIALQLCPELIIIPPNGKKYTYYSNIVMSIFKKYDDYLEIYSIDEASLSFDTKQFSKALDLLKEKNINTENAHFNFPGVEFLVENIRKEVKEKTKLTVSAGISVSRGLAKLCTGINKPDGQFTLNKNIQKFLEDMPIIKINGIGKRMNQLLNIVLDIKTIKDLKSKLHFIYLLFGGRTFYHIFRLCYGFTSHDSTKSHANKERLTVGREISFKPTNDYKELCHILWDSIKKLNERMLFANVEATSISIKIKHDDFSVTQKQRKTKNILSIENMYNISLELFNKIFNPKKNL
ncbi:DNA directed polymerase kappa [Spraguea lophii 42_110]|uniref:DNA polymerase kappa n=1 Tax=Spraguea lophii (strain 42_110) TaxID=1358809 RepID=S7W7T3_SPRLO|nr:DNA directed polymerase kappa [Spraguea lophii 42_110]